MQGKLEEGDDRRLKIREMQVTPGFLGPYTLEDKAGGKQRKIYPFSWLNGSMRV